MQIADKYVTKQYANPTPTARKINKIEYKHTAEEMSLSCIKALTIKFAESLLENVIVTGRMSRNWISFNCC